MLPVFAIADAHGRADLVLGLLEQEGLIDENEKRTGDAVVLQLGDLANCVASSERADLEALRLAREGLIDIILVGNHEHPYFGGTPFSGYWPHGDIRRELFHIRDRGRLRAAYDAHGVLVTHAGVSPNWRRWLQENEAAPLAAKINYLWENDPRLPVFNAIGKSRGGWANEGGILWADWSEPKPRKLKQVIGHSVGDTLRVRWETRCIDLGAGKGSTRIAGAWIRPGGLVETVIFETRTPHAVAA